MDKIALKTLIKVRLANVLIFLLSLAIWLLFVFILFNYINSTVGNIVVIWLILLSPIFIILFIKKYRNKILKNIFKIREFEINYYHNLTDSSNFRRILKRINDLSYWRAFAIMIVFTVLLYSLLILIFDINFPYIFTFILIPVMKKN